jgi:fucose 4-O-acetylase-like acetyltransferase
LLSEPTRPRDWGVESLRGVAMMLVVAGHVIGSDSTGGLTVGDDSTWRFFYLALEDVRMPLFSVLSGFVYAYRPVLSPAGMRQLVRAKVRRLLVPYLVVGTVFFFSQMVMPGAHRRPTIDDLGVAYLFGYGHLWFLQAIFLVFVIVSFMDSIGALVAFRSWAIATTGACALFVVLAIPPEASIFSVDRALRLLPFFLLGYGLHRFSRQLLQARVQIASFVLLMPIYALRIRQIVVYGNVPGMPIRALSLAVGTLATVLLFAARNRLASNLLVRLGGFSFGIYLLHVFGSAGARIMGTRAGVSNTPVLFVLGLIAGIVLPILFEVSLGRYNLISWAVLGQKAHRGGHTDAVASRVGGRHRRPSRRAPAAAAHSSAQRTLSSLPGPSGPPG